ASYRARGTLKAMTRRKNIHHGEHGVWKDLHHGDHRGHGARKRKILGFPSVFRTAYSPRPLCPLWCKCFVLFVALALLPCYASSQESTPTVRHHAVQETTAETSPEVGQGEAAIQKGDYATAQSLLEKAV